MMSSEEETEFGLYADKLLKKAKRTRQRVDAGEPRNSYSSIPNFSSRPSFLGGNNNLYGAIFTQQQHFGLFGPGFGGPGAKMLNELLAGRQKADGGGSAAATAADSGDEVVKYECNAASRCGDGGVVSPPPGAELAAHHMLRDILQGRKHELLGLAAEHASAADNLLVNNNNNNNNNNETIKAQQRTERDHLQQTTQQTQQPPSSQQQSNNTTAMMTTTGSARDQVGGGDSESREPSREREQPRSGGSSTANDSGAEQAALLDDREVGDGSGSTGSLGGGRQVADLMDEALTGMDTDSLPSPKLEPASPAKPEDAKKARVENIVSGMRSSPAPPQVNGCKKRKLYQPQQHDSAADRYIDEEDDELEPIRQQKRIEKNALKSQLRTMQEQLAEMQQKYVQLCTRMEQESNCEEVEEMPSDSEDTVKRSSPAASPISREPPTAPSSAPPVSLAQQVSKLKIGPPHHVPAHFNGMLHDHHHHPHMSNAAAMYLGVSHKLFLEQEARMAKEAAVAAAVAESQHHHQQQQQAAAQQQAQQHAAAAAAAQQHAAQQHAAAQQQQAQQAAQQHHQQQQQQAAQHAAQHQQQTPPSASLPCKPDNIAERLNMIRNMTPTGSELEGLADALKSEITASLSNIIDAIVTRFVHQRRLKQSEASAAAEQLNKDLMLASQMLDRKSPRIKLADSRQANGPQVNGSTPMMNGGSSYPPMMSGSAAAAAAMQHMNNMQKAAAAGELHSRPPMFQPPKPPGMGSVPMYPGMSQHPFCAPERDNPEQNEALSLVVTPKKKRHKVTDTRITPRTVSRILAQDGMGMSPATVEQNSCPSPRPYHQPPPPPMLPVSLPTSVAIPNPGLHESQVFSPYSPFFHGPSHGHHIPMQASSSPPGINKLERESPPLPHPPTLLHPALLAAAQHGTSPDYSHMRAPSGALNMDTGDRLSDCNSGDISYDGIQPTSSTLTPMHLRKAKLMFFWVRYPSSAVLKMYFPDIKFNKNNTAQLVKWFSNFREFYYIQMEKYARQAVSEGVKNADDLHVSGDSEIYRVLNLHYNRNNHIEVWGPQVPPNFRFVVEQTLREFFKAIQGGKDAEQSWKKSIYKIISRLDDPVPEYFKSPNFLEQLE